MSNLMIPYRGNLLKPFNVLTTVEGLSLYLDKNKNVNTKITASFIAANSEYLSNTSVDFKKGNEDFSFGGWVYCNDTSTQRIVGRYTSAGNRSYIIYKDAANFYLQLSNDGTAVIDLAGGAYTAGSWYFVCGVYDSVNNLQKISVNGGAFNTISNTTGAYSGGSANFELSNSDLIPLDGSIDAAFFYNKALSLAEIQALYSSGNGTDYVTLTDHNGVKYPIGQKLNGTADAFNADTLVADLSTKPTGTWSAWVKPTTALVLERFISFGDTNANTSILFYKNVAANLGIYCIEAGVVQHQVLTDSAVFTDNTWTHIAVVMDDVLPVLYINGVAVAQTTTVNTNTTLWVNDISLLDNARVGCSNYNLSGDGTFFTGVIDEVGIWNTNLSAAEILALYNSGTGLAYSDLTTAQKTNLVSWWSLDNVEGASQVDSVTTSANNLIPIKTPVSDTGKVVDTTITLIEASLVDWWRLNETSGDRAGELGHTLIDNKTVGYAIGKVREVSVTATNVANFIAANSEYLSSTSTSFDKGNEDFSFGCWFKLNSIGAGTTHGIVGKWAGGAFATESYLIDVEDTAINVFISSDGSTFNVKTSSVPATAGSWFFVVGVYDSVNNLLKISVNGSSFDTVSHTGGAFASSSDFKVGQYITDVKNYNLDGSIDIPFFYNKALSLAEIQALYANGDHLPYSELTTAQKASLVSYWDLDEKTGTRYDDHGSNGLTDNNTVGYAEFNRLGKIYSWVDQSLNLFIFSQPDVTKQPLLTTKSVNMNGIDEFLMYSAVQPLNDSSGILFFSWYSDGVSARSFLTSSDNSMTDNFINFQELGGGAIRILVANSGVWTSVTSTNLPVVGYNYGYIKSTSTSYVISLNGVIETKVVTSGADDGTWFADILGRDNLSLAYVDRSTADVFFSDEADKILYSNADLSPARINQINSYMSIPSK